ALLRRRPPYPPPLPYPTPFRSSRTSACHWVGRGNLKILLDCGAGALHRLAQFGLPWHQITHVVVSRQAELRQAKQGARATVEQRSEEHTSELQSPDHLVCPLLL